MDALFVRPSVPLDPAEDEDEDDGEEKKEEKDNGRGGA